MALNDEADRLKTAEEYLLNYPADSQEFEAALEHVRWVHAQKPEFRSQCENIFKNVIHVRGDETRTMRQLRTAI